MTRQIDTDAVINSVRLKETTVPATPAAGYRNLYVKTTGLFLIDDAGNEYQISPDVIGTANQILRVNSGATGVEYASIGRVLISEQTPTGTGTVTWSSIPATYKSLELEYVARGTQAATSTNITLRFNNDTTDANYQRFITGGSGTTTAVNSGADDAVIGAIAAASATAGCAGYGTIKVNNYASTTFWKSAIVAMAITTANTVGQTRYSTALTWENTGAINRIDLILVANNYDTGSTFRLYGVY